MAIYSIVVTSGSTISTVLASDASDFMEAASWAGHSKPVASVANLVNSGAIYFTIVVSGASHNLAVTSGG